MDNYEKIKYEYISGDMSLRSVARKHGVAESTLLRRRNREGWTKERRSYRKKVNGKVIEKLAKSDRKEKLSDIEKLTGVVSALLDKTVTAVEDLDKAMIDGDIVEVPVSRRDIRQLTAAVKDLADILGFTNQNMESDGDDIRGLIFIPEVKL